MAEGQAEDGPIEIRHCDGCGEDYNAFEESHVGHEVRTENPRGMHEHDAAGCYDCDCFSGPPNSISCTCPPSAASDLDSRREELDGAPDHQWQVTTPEEVYDHE